MATVSIPMVANGKPSELAWWKVYDENHTYSGIELKAAHEKMLMYGNPYKPLTSKPSDEFTASVAAPEVPITSPELAREKALAYVREARAAVGAKKLKKLPRGRVGKGDECVLARALPYCVSVQGSMVQFKDATIAGKVAQAWATVACGATVITPDALCHFVYHFDNRQYEDLIA